MSETTGGTLIEALTGALALAAAVGFALYVGQRQARAPEGYALSASFAKADGLSVGAEARVSGVKVGSVAEVRLDPSTYRAVVRMQMRGDLKLPTDSSAKIASDGLLGGAYVAIEPGGDEAMLAPGAEIEHTQGSINLLDMVGRAIYGTGK